MRPLGATRDQEVDVRVIAATVRNLRREVEEGRFREDLYYRLNVLQINVPPLRDRRDDIMLLVEHFIERNNSRLGTKIRDLDQRTRKLLLNHPWPGNVRELANTIERLLLLAGEQRLTGEDLPPDFDVRPTSGGTIALPAEGLSWEELERDLVRQALELAHGNRTQAAKLLRLPYRTFLYRLERLGLKS